MVATELVADEDVGPDLIEDTRESRGRRRAVLGRANRPELVRRAVTEQAHDPKSCGG